MARVSANQLGRVKFYTVVTWLYDVMIELPYHLVYFESIKEYWKGCEGNPAVRYTYTNPHICLCADSLL